MSAQKASPTFTPEDLISIPQAAKELGVNWSTVYRWVKKGLIPHVPIASQMYIHAEDLKALKKKRNQGKAHEIDCT